ncbi:unnamed protein product [Meloidogyne enterolobii]|uniref:Uncharacterized protein n=1 Tax=Meloidogyne enterolobii TaxID=390850 RepID=A0ACB1B5M3_MELEN
MPPNTNFTKEEIMSIRRNLQGLIEMIDEEVEDEGIEFTIEQQEGIKIKVQKKLEEATKKSKAFATFLGSLGGIVGSGALVVGCSFIYSIPFFGQILLAATALGALVGGYNSILIIKIQNMGEDSEIEIKRKIEEAIHRLIVIEQKNLQREEEAIMKENLNAQILEFERKLKIIQQKNKETKLFMFIGSIYGTISGGVIYGVNCLYNEEIDLEKGGIIIFGSILIGALIGGLTSKYR